MQCSSPRYVWQHRAVNPSGKRGIAFSAKDGLPGTGYWMRCGKCTNCRMRVTGDWSVRMMHEVIMSRVSSVGTLTFDDQHVPDCIEDMRPMVKAFKERCRWRDIDCRSHWLLEYGGKFGRPHAHVVFFRHDFRNGVYKIGDSSVYGSEEMDNLWGMGHVHLDVVSPAACRYTCGHNAGKLLVSPLNEDGKKNFFFIPAKRPAVGMEFARKFADDFRRVKAAVLNGNLTAVPRAYLKYEPELFEPVKAYNMEYAKSKGCVDIPLTVEDSKRLEVMQQTLVMQAKEIQAWHRGSHEKREPVDRASLVQAGRDRANMGLLVKGF